MFVGVGGVVCCLLFVVCCLLFVICLFVCCFVLSICLRFFLILFCPFF